MTTITLPWPPSVNGYWRAIPRGRGVVQILSEDARDFRADVARIVTIDRANGEALRFGDARLKVTVTLHPPTRRAFDIDNFGGKAILDALTKAHVWTDDCQVDQLHIYRGPVVKGGSAVIVIDIIP